MDFSKRRTLTSGGGTEKGSGMVGVVKKVDRAPNGAEQRVKVKTESSAEASIYVPKKYARDLKPEHKYEFHLVDEPFRGGGQRTFSGVEMSHRTKVQPAEVKTSNMGGSSTGGGFTRR